MPGDCRKPPGVPMSLLPNQQSLNEEDGALSPTRAHEKDELWLLSLVLGLSFPCVCSQNNSDLSGPTASSLQFLLPDNSDSSVLAVQVCAFQGVLLKYIRIESAILDIRTPWSTLNPI